VASAQNVRIQEFAPGNYLAGTIHRVVLQNTTNSPVNLGGYLLVTRDYSLRFPNTVRLRPGGQLRIGNSRRADPSLDLELTQIPDFLVRIYSQRVPGNYVALLTPNGVVLDAFYHSDLSDVPFLPDSGQLILANNTPLPFRLPTETAPVWRYFPFAGDPAVGFERAGNQWRITAANPNIGSLYPVLSVRDFTARYREGVVTLKWRAERMENIRMLVLERSTDQRTYSPVTELPANPGATEATPYVYFDNTATEGETYFYRIRNRDVPGQVVYSQTLEVEATEVPVEFWLQVYPAQTNRLEDVGIKFYSALTQQVRIELLDERFREVAILYSDPVYAETQNLLRLVPGLPPGFYWVVASTDAQRYVARLRLGNQ
jgi:hypothetical protein